MTADDGGIDRRSLLLEIKRTLNRSELSDACFFLKIDPEDLTQGGRSDLARELVLYCERHNCMDDLLACLKRERPDIDWALVYHLDDVQEKTVGERDTQNSGTVSAQAAGQDTDSRKDSSNEASIPEEPKQRILPCFIINILLFALVFLLFIPWLLSKLPPDLIYCASDLVVKLSLTLITLLLFHALWRVLSRALEGKTEQTDIEVKGTKIPFGVI